VLSCLWWPEPDSWSHPLALMPERLHHRRRSPISAARAGARPPPDSCKYQGMQTARITGIRNHSSDTRAVGEESSAHDTPATLRYNRSQRACIAGANTAIDERVVRADGRKRSSRLPCRPRAKSSFVLRKRRSTGESELDAKINGASERVANSDRIIHRIGRPKRASKPAPEPRPQAQRAARDTTQVTARGVCDLPAVPCTTLFRSM
jgi:hypothetical protein